MRSHVDRYAAAGVARTGGPGMMNGSGPELTPLLYTRHNLKAALDSIRYITMHVVKENEVREVSGRRNVHIVDIVDIIAPVFLMQKNSF